MLFIDFNASIAVLIFVALAAYILILRRLKPEVDASQQIAEQDQRIFNRPDEKNLKEQKNLRKGNQASNPETESSCLNHLGYLGTLPKNSIIPDQCLGCTKIVKCLTRKNAREETEDEALERLADFDLKKKQ